MKIAIRRGHNFQATGSSALLKEVEENAKILVPTIKYLKALGHEVLDVSPSNMTASSDLAHGVSKANSWGADLFVSIHCNKAYDSYNGAIGSECIVYSKSDNYKDEVIAQRIVNNLGALGFKNRGVKERTDLYELKHTKMNAVLVECFFLEATEDVALYKKIGADSLGKAIAEGIANQKIPIQQSTQNPHGTSTTQPSARYRVIVNGTQVGAYSNVENVLAQIKSHIANSTSIEIKRI